MVNYVKINTNEQVVELTIVSLDFNLNIKLVIMEHVNTVVITCVGKISLNVVILKPKQNNSVIDVMKLH